MDVPQVLLSALTEGLSEATSGEVVVRDGTSTGRIYLCGGAIAWVTCDRVGRRLGDLLRTIGGVDTESLHAAIAECQRTRGNFGETLMEWGLITRDGLRACLLEHNASHLNGLITMSPSMRALFVPQEREYSSDLVFSLEEILAATVSSSEVPAVQCSEEIKELLEDTRTKIPDCLGIGCVDLCLGGAIYCAVEGGDSEAWQGSMVEIGKLLSAGPGLSNLGEAYTSSGAAEAFAREALMMGGGMLQTYYRIPELPDVALVTVCQSPRNFGLTLGMAREAIRSAGQKLQGLLAEEFAGSARSRRSL